MKAEIDAALNELRASHQRAAATGREIATLRRDTLRLLDQLPRD